MTLLEIARFYSSLGWSVIPLQPRTKIPAVKWDAYQERKPTDEELVKWFSDGKANIGLACGKVSGVVVVDQDSYKGKAGITIDSPIKAATGGGGIHCYFKYSGELGNSVSFEHATDIRANGGQVVLPPSIHPSGTRYTWVTKPTPELLANLPELPKEIINTLSLRSDNLNFDLASTIGVSEGGRNDALHKALCSMLSKLKDQDREAVGWNTALGINNTFKPPLPEREVQTTFRSALNFVRSSPPISTNYINSSHVSGNLTQSTLPLSMGDVGKRRNEERELEKGAPGTGYPELDRLVGGFLPKHFWTLTGETNVGKTAFACNLAENVRKQGKKVLYVALEPDYKVVDYLATIRTGKNFQDLSDTDLTFDDGLIDIFTLAEVPTYQDLIKSIKESPVKYDLVVIDHIGYFCRSSDGGQYLQEQATTIRDLVQLSKRVNTCIVAIAHPRKPSLNAKARIISLYDVSGSATFAQDSTEVAVIYRPPESDDPTNPKLSDVGAILIQKTKNGENGSFKVTFNKGTALIKSRDSLQTPTKFVTEKLSASVEQERPLNNVGGLDPLSLGDGDKKIIQYLIANNGYAKEAEIKKGLGINDDLSPVLESLAESKWLLSDEDYGYSVSIKVKELLKQ